MYNKILVPLDGSKRAEAILPHVEEMARRYTASVAFLEVIEPDYSVIPAPYGGEEIYRVFQQTIEEQTAEAKTYLKGIRGEFKEKGINADIHIAHGQVIHAILNTAETEDVDLIAMSSHGRTGLPRVFYGSIAAGILHRTHLPVFLIRAHTGDEG